MNYPPSLPKDVLMRSFVALNGEIGILIEDAPKFLQICADDHLDILGWEMWLVDHVFDGESQRPISSLGNWCGLIPLRSSSSLALVGGSGGRIETAKEISDLLPEQWWNKRG
jgi:hypothetical protein